MIKEKIKRNNSSCSNSSKNIFIFTIIIIIIVFTLIISNEHVSTCMNVSASARYVYSDSISS